MKIAAILFVVFASMLVELRRSSRHERMLRSRGAVEPPGDAYAVMQVAYPLSFIGPAIEGLLKPSGGARLAAAGLIVFAAAKALKYWAIATLGERWTFKVLVPPGASRVVRGPYRFLAHPNYLAVAGEIAGAAAMMNAPWTGLAFTFLFGWLMLWRIRIEERALL